MTNTALAAVDFPLQQLQHFKTSYVNSNGTVTAIDSNGNCIILPNSNTTFTFNNTPSVTTYGTNYIPPQQGNVYDFTWDTTVYLQYSKEQIIQKLSDLFPDFVFYLNKRNEIAIDNGMAKIIYTNIKLDNTVDMNMFDLLVESIKEYIAD